MRSLKIYSLASLAMLMMVAGASAEAKKEKTMASKRAAGTYAIFDTSMGSFVVKLFPEEAPKTVENFIGLAEGTKEFKDPSTGKMVKRPLYNGLVFHRIIKDFMIQGGDPLGNGTGGPGYSFEDEFNSPRVFDKPGILAMANAGPNTNGSQFFITVVPTPWLNRHHTIFGEVVEGYPVVDKMSLVETSPGNNRPLKPVTITTVKIERVK